MSTAPRKRTRTSDAKVEPEDEPQNVQLFQHHPRLWYDDGNVNLVARGDVAFKVHRSVLSRESVALENILSAGSQRLEEGCPIYVLSDDPEDVAQMLEYLYGFNRSYSEFKQLPFSVVRAHFRMGDKYEIQRLREDAVDRLRICYPDTLQGYDDRPSHNSVHRPIAWTHGEGYAVLKLALASKTGALHSVVPIALYDSCGLYPRDLVKDIEADDAKDGESSKHRWAIWKRFLVGTYELERTYAVRKSPDTFQGNSLSLEHVEKLIDETMHKKVCRPCISLAKERHREGRQKAWDKLVGIFDLPVVVSDVPEA
ncbi:hypothetical protein BV25DRAFT_1988729 [Artomyces pyxidatus]|uniref:Uncharacterized protein n=1 Tax=Artomyces pyxidatus TaxID=48021 RepID=A0ACB8TD67_9AGAM|nr:hypothetical protein BV25DRAFT_1988729 [Artomyces pyxidatus]